MEITKLNLGTLTRFGVIPCFSPLNSPQMYQTPGLVIGSGKNAVVLSVSIYPVSYNLSCLGPSYFKSFSALTNYDI